MSAANRPAQNSGDVSVWPHRLAVILACATFPLLFIGGLVTSHGAGLAVPDWPTTYGYNMFFFPISKWVGGILYEHTHRLVASLVGLMTAILAAWLWLKEERRWLRWLGVAAFVAVALQMAHRIVGVLILGAVALAAWTARRQLGWRSALARLSFVWLGLILLQALLGVLTVLKNKPADIATAHVAAGALSLLTGSLLTLMAARLLMKPVSKTASLPYAFSATAALPLPVRNERGEGRGEGHPTADTLAHLQARRPSSPQPSPPPAGGEGEEPNALNPYSPPGALPQGAAK